MNQPSDLKQGELRITIDLMKLQQYINSTKHLLTKMEDLVDTAVLKEKLNGQAKKR